MLENTPTHQAIVMNSDACNLVYPLKHSQVSHQLRMLIKPGLIQTSYDYQIIYQYVRNLSQNSYHFLKQFYENFEQVILVKKTRITCSKFS